MTQEARTFVADLVWNDRNFMDLFTANYGFVNVELAPIYKVHGAGQGVRPRAFPGGIGARRNTRPGAVPGAHRQARRFISHGARAFRPRAVSLPARARSAAGVNTNLPPVTEAKPQTNRDRMSEHTNNPSCATCHKLMDPIGFGLEKFDAHRRPAR